MVTADTLEEQSECGIWSLVVSIELHIPHIVLRSVTTYVKIVGKAL